MSGTGCADAYPHSPGAYPVQGAGLGGAAIPLGRVA